MAHTQIAINRKQHSQIEVREVMKDYYLPFAGIDSDNSESAEMYCYMDVMNYDNFDFITNPKVKQTYYCIAFNVRQAVCGDGIVDENHQEQCDDGNMIDGDGCSASCTTEYCGDAIDNNGDTEECDDGNITDDDLCNNQCQLNPVCGNDILEGEEECDDGNITDGDGCSASCNLEPLCNEFVNDYVNEVLLNTQGMRKDGSGVLPVRSNPSDVLGLPDGVTTPSPA